MVQSGLSRLGMVFNELGWVGLDRSSRLGR